MTHCSFTGVNEFHRRYHLSLYLNIVDFLTHASSVLMTLFTFGIYFWLEERNLDAGNVFASLALFSQLAVPLFIFPAIVPIIINAMVRNNAWNELLSSILLPRKEKAFLRYRFAGFYDEIGRVSSAARNRQYPPRND